MQREPNEVFLDILTRTAKTKVFYNISGHIPFWASKSKTAGENSSLVNSDKNSHTKKLDSTFRYQAPCRLLKELMTNVQVVIFHHI